MMALLWLFVSVAGYLGGGRAVFWGLTMLDWPKSRSRNDCGHGNTYHRHSDVICPEGRDLIRSRDRRVMTAYLWPLIFPFAFTYAVGAVVVRGSYKTITYPITNPGERRARRLALEQDVAAAEEAARAAEHPPLSHGQQARVDRPVSRPRPPIEYHASYHDDDYEPTPEVR